jgi:hypothetical protein
VLINVEDMGKAVVGFTPRLLAETKCQGVSLAVADEIGLRMSRVFGDWSAHEPVDVPCFGRVVSAVALLHLHQSGQVGLDEPLSAFSQMRHVGAGASATPRQLLRGGVSQSIESMQGVVEAVTMRRFSAYALERLYRPLQMQSTEVNGIGGSRTTASDQTLLLDALLHVGRGGRQTVLTAETVVAMVTPDEVIAEPADVLRGLGVDVGRAGEELEWFGTSGRSPRGIDACARAYPGLGVSAAVICVEGEHGVAERVMDHLAATAQAMLHAKRELVGSGQAA